jgi:hypothetical protein
MARQMSEGSSQLSDTPGIPRSGLLHRGKGWIVVVIRALLATPRKEEHCDGASGFDLVLNLDPGF